MNQYLSDKHHADAYEGMTVNERLFVARLLDVWDKAVIGRDRNTMIDTLVAVHFARQSAEQITNLVLAQQPEVVS